MSDRLMSSCCLACGESVHFGIAKSSRWIGDVYVQKQGYDLLNLTLLADILLRLPAMSLALKALAKILHRQNHQILRYLYLSDDVLYLYRRRSRFDLNPFETFEHAGQYPLGSTRDLW